ncbi:hypothetical protein CSUI_011012 [Cystoisospora suis]|uniref:Uncharacterized protein n=1 Tax=Cystoisospora suis TaxID=483139 RepID=A0A2C6KB80_9APIC|nr:hypothetical protein CSUI_011012 [Cystoisospora suis]
MQQIEQLQGQLAEQDMRLHVLFASRSLQQASLPPAPFSSSSSSALPLPPSSPLPPMSSTPSSNPTKPSSPPSSHHLQGGPAPSKQQGQDQPPHLLVHPVSSSRIALTPTLTPPPPTSTYPSTRHAFPSSSDTPPPTCSPGEGGGGGSHANVYMNGNSKDACLHPTYLPEASLEEALRDPLGHKAAATAACTSSKGALRSSSSSPLAYLSVSNTSHKRSHEGERGSSSSSSSSSILQREGLVDTRREGETRPLDHPHKAMNHAAGPLANVSNSPSILTQVRIGRGYNSSSSSSHHNRTTGAGGNEERRISTAGGEEHLYDSNNYSHKGAGGKSIPVFLLDDEKSSS